MAVSILFRTKNCIRAKNFRTFRDFFHIFRPRGNFFDGPIFFQNLADSAAIRLVQKSSKSEPSSPFFGRLKFRGKFVPCYLLQNSMRVQNRNRHMEKTSIFLKPENSNPRQKDKKRRITNAAGSKNDNAANHYNQRVFL